MSSNPAWKPNPGDRVHSKVTGLVGEVLSVWECEVLVKIDDGEQPDEGVWSIGDVEPIPPAEPALPTYETYFHGEKLVHCDGCGKQVLQVLHSCKGIPAPVLSQDVPIPLSESVEADGGEGDGTEALKAELVEALRLAAQTRPEDLGLSEHEQWYVDFNCVDCDAETLYAVLAHGLAAAGWRPPLPPWKAQLREATGFGSPEPVYTAGDLIEAYAEAERRLRAEGWTPPLPADEVEKAVDVFGHDGRFLYAGLLQARADGGWNVFHHTDSRHIAAVPVEPKETTP